MWRHCGVAMGTYLRVRERAVDELLDILDEIAQLTTLAALPRRVALLRRALDLLPQGYRLACVIDFLDSLGFFIFCA
jgi:hypothetical protein